MKVTLKRGNITYIAYISSLGAHLAEGTLWLKTNRKIFRKKYIDSFSFFVSDYNSIIEGIEHAIVKIEAKQAKEADTCDKWRKFNEETKRRRTK